MRFRPEKIDEDEVDFDRFLEYNELSPSCLVWKNRPLSEFRTKTAYETFHIRYAGETAGSLDTYKGYPRWRVNFNHRFYAASRIIHILKIGLIPVGMEVDHKDCNSANNKVSNLRLATHGQNQANSKAWGKLGIKGVQQVGKKFVAHIYEDGLVRNIGRFDTPEEANAAYMAAAYDIHGEFA